MDKTCTFSSHTIIRIIIIIPINSRAYATITGGQTQNAFFRGYDAFVRKNFQNATKLENYYYYDTTSSVTVAVTLSSDEAPS